MDFVALFVGDDAEGGGALAVDLGAAFEEEEVAFGDGDALAAVEAPVFGAGVFDADNGLPAAGSVCIDAGGAGMLLPRPKGMPGPNIGRFGGGEAGVEQADGQPHDKEGKQGRAAVVVHVQGSLSSERTRRVNPATGRSERKKQRIGPHANAPDTRPGCRRASVRQVLTRGLAQPTVGTVGRRGALDRESGSWIESG